MKSFQYCGVTGRFDDDIEIIGFIVSNRGVAFIGNGETACLSGASLCFQHPTPNKDKTLNRPYYLPPVLTFRRHPNDGYTAVMSLLGARIYVLKKKFSGDLIFYAVGLTNYSLVPCTKNDLRTRRINHDVSYILVAPFSRWSGMQCFFRFFRIGKVYLDVNVRWISFHDEANTLKKESGVRGLYNLSS